jgi:hypothetical protein
LAQRVRPILRYCRKRLRLYQVLQIDGQIYSDTYVGNLELQYVCDYTAFILRELRYSHGDEFEKYIADVDRGKYKFSWIDEIDTSKGTLY